MRILDETEVPGETRGRPSLYPWDRWLIPEKTVRLHQGEDFKIEPSSMRPQAHNQATKRGGRAHTSLGEDENGRYIDVTYTPGLTEKDVEGDFEFEKTS
jgi:hypothetical protein